MATIFDCPQRVSCPGTDYPVSNYSSEADDGPTFVYVNWPSGPQITGYGGGAALCASGSVLIDGQCWKQICPDGSDPINGLCGPGDCPPGSVFVDGQCWIPDNQCVSSGIGIGESFVSLEDSVLCATLWSELCGNIDTFSFCTPPFWPSADAVPGPGLFFNKEQSCTARCPDGSEFTYTIPAGRVVTDSQDLSDRIALSLVCNLANSNKVCITPAHPKSNPSYDPLRLVGNTGFCCAGEQLLAEPMFEVTGTGAWNFTSSGQIPIGTTLVQFSDTEAGFIGTLNVPGIYNFSIIASNNFGQSVSHAYTINLVGLQSNVLADGTVGTAYSAQVVALGVIPPVTIIPLAPLPPGLSMSPSGAISGTPTTPGTY